MKITLRESDLKTLVETKKGWEYSITTKNGRVRGSEITTKAAALRHAEDNLLVILKSLLKK